MTSSQQRQEQRMTSQNFRRGACGEARTAPDAPLPASAVRRALALIGAVHEHGPEDVAHILHGLTRAELNALAVSLAAMTPDDYSAVELLAWNDSRYQRPEPAAVVSIPIERPLRPHGTHAAFVYHRNHQEEPCTVCWYGEREYQRERKRRSRREDVAVAS